MVERVRRMLLCFQKLPFSPIEECCTTLNIFILTQHFHLLNTRGEVTFVLSNIGAPTSPKINGKSPKGKQLMYSSATLSGGLRALTVDLGFARRIPQLLFCVNISSKFSSMVALLVVFLPCGHKPYLYA